jgi:hypothetical protein
MDGTMMLWIATYEDADDALADLAALEQPDEEEPPAPFEAAVIDRGRTLRAAGGAALVVFGEPAVERRVDRASARAARIVTYAFAATREELALA